MASHNSRKIYIKKHKKDSSSLLGDRSIALKMSSKNGLNEAYKVGLIRSQSMSSKNGLNEA
jgi:hypothetical protein